MPKLSLQLRTEWDLVLLYGVNNVYQVQTNRCVNGNVYSYWCSLRFVLKRIQFLSLAWYEFFGWKCKDTSYANVDTSAHYIPLHGGTVLLYHQWYRVRCMTWMTHPLRLVSRAGFLHNRGGGGARKS